MDNRTGPDPERETAPITSTPATGSTGTGTRGERRIRFQRSSSWYWPTLNLAGLVAVVAINFLANWLKFNGQTTGEVVTKDPVSFQPATWAFTIWALIYVVLAVFVVYGFLPGGRRSRRVRRIGPLFLSANLANIAWIFLWHWEQFTATLIVMVILLISLVVIYILAHAPDRQGRAPTRTQRFAIQLPFSLYLGWICVATLANTAVWLDRRHWNDGPFSPTAWAVIFIVVGLILTAGMALFRHDATFAVVFVWAYVAIAQQQWGHSKLVAIVAGVAAVGAAAATVFAFMLSFDRRAMSGYFSETHRDDPLPLE